VGLLLTDPVGLGLVATEARPGTNVTGILIRVLGMAGKQVEIATDLLPDLKKVGILVGLDNPSNLIQRDEAETAARKLGIKLVAADVRKADEISSAFHGFVREGVGVVLVSTYALFTTLRRQISAFALASRVPTIYSDREAVDYGGLVSYGISRGQTYQRAAYYVNRILRGEKPADLPVEFPTKLELVINLATAKALGLSVAPTLLARADEVIE
jgi:putative ABC transport system substrate-binding protein